MKAKEMFEELGYRKITKSYFTDRQELLDKKKMIRYDKENKNKTDFKAFIFYKKNLYLSTYSHNDYEITPKELKAINKQMEELGWK